MHAWHSSHMLHPADRSRTRVRALLVATLAAALLLAALPAPVASAATACTPTSSSAGTAAAAPAPPTPVPSTAGTRVGRAPAALTPRVRASRAARRILARRVDLLLRSRPGHRRVTRPVVRRPAVLRAKLSLCLPPTRPAATRPGATPPAATPPAATPFGTPAGPAAAGPAPVASVAAAQGRVPQRQAPGRTGSAYFGIHGTPSTGAAQSFGSVRLWDSGTTWAELEPAPGQWRWDALDAAVATAEQQGLEPVLVLGQTPAWASADPRVPGVAHDGESMPPRDPGTWSTYVATVAQRYAGRICAYEVWNEPNYVSDYYHGTEAQLAELTHLAHAALRSVDATALLVSPGFATRTRGQRGWFSRYLDVVDPRDLDVVALHLYPPSEFGPEEAVGQLASVTVALRARGITAPVWNTEVNYGVVGGTSHATPLPGPTAAAFVARTLLLDRAAGVERIYWYAWGTRDNVAIALDDAAGPTEALDAWHGVRDLLVSATLLGCAADGTTWTCRLTLDAGGWARVVWSTATGPATVTAPPGVRSVATLGAPARPVAPGEEVALSGVPVVLRG